MKNNINIGDNIRYYRKKNGYTQEQLVEKSSLSLNFISAVERGAKNITFNNLLLIASALNVPIATLVSPLTSTNSSHHLKELTRELQKLPLKEQEQLIQNFINITHLLEQQL